MHAPRAITVLITGFGPFPGAPVNASADLVAEITPRLQRRYRAKRIVSHIMPTEWERAPHQLARLYEYEQPSLAIHFGVSSKAKTLVLERKAENRRRPSPDANGQLPLSHHIDVDGPRYLEARLPFKLITSRLGAINVPFRFSNNAGAYLCNAVLYHSLQLAQERQVPVLSGFVHIPSEIPPRVTSRSSMHTALTWEKAVSGAIEIVRASIGAIKTQQG